jgi:polysaccharide biosynthesis transport protein
MDRSADKSEESSHRAVRAAGPKQEGESPMVTSRNEQSELLDRDEVEGISSIALAMEPAVVDGDEVPPAAAVDQALATLAHNRSRAASAPPSLRRRGLMQTWRHAWMMALCLGLGVGALVARGVWQLQPAPRPVYQATSLLRVDWSHPQLANLVGDRAKIDGGERVQAMSDLIRSRSVIQAALSSTAAADLTAVRDNPDEAFRRLEQGLRVESNNSQVLRLTLTGEDADDLPAMVNGVKKAFLKTYVEDDRRAKRSRLAEMDKSYKEILKELVKSRKELQATGARAESDLLDGGRLEEFQKELSRAEIELVAARVKLASLQENPPKEAEKADIEITDAQIEKLANKDRKLRDLQAQADKLLAYIRNLERISSKPATLPEYKDAVADHQSLLQAIARRKRSLRPELEKLIRESTEEKLPVENPLEVAKREVALYEAQVKELSKRVHEQVSARSVINEGRQKLALRRAELAEQKTQEVERLQKTADTTFAEAEAIRKELNGPVAAVALEDAELAERLPLDETKGMRIAGYAGLAAFCLVVLGVSYREHLQGRIHHPDDVVHELSLTLLASTPALADRLDLFGAVLEESQPSSAFMGRCRAVDGICPLVLHEAIDGQARVVMVTSAMGEEGESELASLLAYRLARSGKRTLLIDADLASPKIQDVIGESGEPGLSDVLRRMASWTDVIRPAQVSDLWLVMAGRADGLAAEAMARDDMGPLLDQLRPEYDAIVIDASPILTMAHGLQVGRHVDTSILAVRHEVSRTVSVFAAQQRLHMLGVPVLGAVYVAGSSRNWLSGVNPLRGVASIFGAVGHVGGSAWKRFGNLQSPVPQYQGTQGTPSFRESQTRKAA